MSLLSTKRFRSEHRLLFVRPASDGQRRAQELMNFGVAANAIRAERFQLAVNVGEPDVDLVKFV